eukprot:Lankesteria_metandrocarpae@DN10297_c0_g1_i1.p1
MGNANTGSLSIPVTIHEELRRSVSQRLSTSYSISVQSKYAVSNYRRSHNSSRSSGVGDRTHDIYGPGRSRTTGRPNQEEALGRGANSTGEATTASTGGTTAGGDLSDSIRSSKNSSSASSPLAAVPSSSSRTRGGMGRGDHRNDDPDATTTTAAASGSPSPLRKVISPTSPVSLKQQLHRPMDYIINPDTDSFYSEAELHLALFGVPDIQSETRPSSASSTSVQENSARGSGANGTGSRHRTLVEYGTPVAMRARPSSITRVVDQQPIRSASGRVQLPAGSHTRKMGAQGGACKHPSPTSSSASSTSAAALLLPLSTSPQQQQAAVSFAQILGQLSAAHVRRHYRVLATRVTGNPKNHFPFLEAPVLDVLLPFILGHELTNVMSTCPHWFVAIYEHFLRRAFLILSQFRAHTSEHLQIVESAVSVQGLPIKGGFPRVDLLLYARVLPVCAAQKLDLSYSFSYAQRNVEHHQHNSENSLALQSGKKGSSPSNMAAVQSPPAGMLSAGTLIFPDRSTYSDFRGVRGTSTRSHAPRRYNSRFAVNCLQKSRSRDLVLERDITRFHGDEVLVATQPSATTACVGDILEIPVVISNAFGFSDFKSFAWERSVLSGIPPVTNFKVGGMDVDDKQIVWMNLQDYRQTTSELLIDCDCFNPQLRHTSTVFTGIDITSSRSKYYVAVPGAVERARSILGLPVQAVSRDKSVICTMKRLGLQHDRITPIQVRVGDKVTLYMTLGGDVGGNDTR